MQTSSFFTDQSWDGIPRKPTAQFLDQRHCPSVVDFKMSRSLHLIQLMKIVRNHADVDQAFAQLFKTVRTIIDASQQHGLIECRDAGLHEHSQRVFAVAGNFVRVICMDHHDRSQPGVAQ